MQWLANTPWTPIVAMCLTLGLAPFSPPHIVEKLRMLADGTLRRPLDWFDLLMHSAPWMLLALKAAVMVMAKPAT